MSALKPQRSTASTRSASSLSTGSAGGGIDSALETRLTSLLTGPDFSVSQYLNLALIAAPAGQDNNDNDNDNDNAASTSTPEEQEHLLEQRMASLALQLQMRTQSCHDEIGRIGAELQAIVPRCAADVGRLKVGLEGMELDVRGLLEGMDGHTNKSNTKSAASSDVVGGADVGAGMGGEASREDPLTTLHSLLNLRTHLTTSRAILSAASSWDETINSIPMLLSTTPPNLVEAVAALSQLEQGARALQGMPEGRDERDAALRKLRSQLEVLLKPQLLHALKKMDTRLGPLQQCVGMYGSLGKMEVLREEYVRMRPSEIHTLWFSFGGGTGTGTGAAKDANVTGNENDIDVKTDDEEKENEGEEDEEVDDFDFGDDTEDIFPSNSTTQTQTTAKQFMDFLPNFYEAALELLAKERTQSKLVFGPDLAPSIVAQVLLECFKPIINSFEKRLGNLCPVPRRGLSGMGGNSGGTGCIGGTEAIAVAYESTIQFLSLAYDQMEAWNGGASINDDKKDSKESPATSSDPAHDTLLAIRSAFLLIALPFAPYQRNLSQAERDPLGEAAAMIAKDVRGVVNFEDAAERLGDLAPFMFPLAEAAINRFELLNSGYNTPSTLSSIDTLISNHASELAIVMGTLSTNASNSRSSSNPNEFDEQHVYCALEILRIAGVFKRSLRSFEHSVRDRLRMLSKVMGNKLLDGKNDVIPDEISSVQIRALMAKEACDPNPTYIDDGTGVKCPTSVVELRRLAGSAAKKGDTPPPLFPKSLDSTSRLARSCLSLVFEVCYAIPERQLHGISALPVWKQEGSEDGEEDEAAYGILPQAFITQVGEHMLALVQALEPFASDAEALGLANEVMAGVMEVAVQPWKEFVAAAGCAFKDRDAKSQLEILMRGKDMMKYFLNDDDTSEDNAAEQEEEEDEEEDADAKASAAFCNQWLDVVGLAVTGRLLERTMRIPRLGRKGAEHLATDLNYIRNVFTALGVTGHPHPLLGYMAQLVTLDDEMLRSKIRRRREGDDILEESETLEVIKRAELRIAYVRSISV